MAYTVVNCDHSKLYSCGLLSDCYVIRVLLVDMPMTFS